MPVSDADTLPESETVEVTDGDAPKLSVPVGVAEFEPERVLVGVGELDDVAVGDTVSVGVGVVNAVVDADGVGSPVSVELWLIDGVGDGVIDGDE